MCSSQAVRIPSFPHSLAPQLPPIGEQCVAMWLCDMVEGALNAQSSTFLLCVCVHVCVYMHFLLINLLRLCSLIKGRKASVYARFLPSWFFFLCMLVSGRERTAIEWACASRRENYKVALYHVCGRVKNAVIVCLETLKDCLAASRCTDIVECHWGVVMCFCLFEGTLWNASH